LPGHTPPPGAKAGEPVWQVALFVAVLAAAVALAYQAIWLGHPGFIWDDDLHLLTNPVLRPGGLSNTWVPGASYLNYWPVTFTAYWLGYQAWGFSPLGFHLVNLGLHIAAAVLVWRVLERLELNRAAAMLGAAIFALHPVNADTAAWIAQLKGILALLFALGATLTYLAFEDRGRWWRYAPALLLFVASALSKGAILTWPLLLLLCAWWRRGRITWRDVWRVVPMALIAAVCIAIEILSQQRAAGHESIRSAGFWTRLAEAGYVVWFYLWKTIWPVNLSAVYRWDWVVNTRIIVCWLPDLAIGAILIVGWLNRRIWGRPVMMATICHLLLLAPVLGFVDVYAMRFSLVADHYQYAAMIVPAAAAAGVLVHGVTRWAGSFRSWLIAPSVVALTAILACLTFVRAGVYRNELSLWTDVLENNPRCWLAHNSLGLALAEQGHIEQAIDQYRQALGIRPDYIEACNNLGNLLLETSRVDEAMTMLEKAVTLADKAVAISDQTPEVKRKFARPHVGLGNALARCGQTDQAIAEYRNALVLCPTDILALSGLGNTLARLGRLDEAIVQYRRALEIDPHFATAHNNLGTALLQRGDLEQALNQYQQAVKARPDYAEAYINAGSILARRGQIDQAIDHFQRALEIQPNSFEAHYDLAIALEQQGHLAEAIEQYQQSVAIRPDFAEARRNLEAARARQR
jgi:tetratricopeptide (TPR) repeat protein